MIHLLLAVIYLSIISLGLPDSLLDSALLLRTRRGNSAFWASRILRCSFAACLRSLTKKCKLERSYLLWHTITARFA